jgi:hypothetical protein
MKYVLWDGGVYNIVAPLDGQPLLLVGNKSGCDSLSRLIDIWCESFNCPLTLFEEFLLAAPTIAFLDCQNQKKDCHKLLHKPPKAANKKALEVCFAKPPGLCRMPLFTFQLSPSKVLPGLATHFGVCG